MWRRLLNYLSTWFHAPSKLRETEKRLMGANARLQISKHEILAAIQDIFGTQVKQSKRDRIMAEMLEAEMLSSNGGMAFARESISTAGQAVVLKERLLELELALDNIGWRRELAYADLEFSRQGIAGIIKISRLYALKNPLVKRGVEIAACYVFGRGVDMISDDDKVNETIREFLALNAKELGHIGLMQKEQTLRTDGNLFLLLFPTPTGQVKVATIDATEVQDIVTDPDDASIPWYYKRMWTAKEFNVETGAYAMQSKTAWYPDIGYQPDAKPERIGRDPVMWDTPVLHGKLGGFPKWLFGCPDIYAALDWARAYKDHLKNWASITKALAQFAWNVETKGGTPAIATIARALGSSVGIGDGDTGDFVDRVPVVPGGSVVHGPGDKWTPMQTRNVTTGPEEGRRIGMMVGSAVGLPETMLFGDASTGSLATAQSLDRPTELYFLQKQERWREMLQRLLTFVLMHSAGSGGGRLREAGRDAKRMSVRMVPRKRLANGRMIEMWEAAKSTLDNIVIAVKFPAILEHDVKSMVDALVSGATLDGKTLAGTCDVKSLAVALMTEWGWENPDKIADQMYPDATYDPEVDAEPVEPTEPPTDTVPTEARRHGETIFAIGKLAEALKGQLNGH